MANIEVTGRKNGPVLIPGIAAYIDQTGTEKTTTRTPLAICRCGQSCNSPFCDGTHRKVEFEAPAFKIQVETEEKN